MMRTDLALLTVLLTGGPAAAELYCPWADAIVQLEFDADQSNVRLTHSLYPRAPTLKVEKRNDPIRSTPVLYFWEKDGRHMYEFYFDPELNSLYNERVDLDSGQKFEQRGHCLLTHTDH